MAPLKKTLAQKFRHVALGDATADQRSVSKAEFIRRSYLVLVGHNRSLQIESNADGRSSEHSFGREAA